jgi:nickel and cobalt resistance protein CnrR
MNIRRTVVIAVIAFVAAIAGVFIGRAVLPEPSHTGAELHALLHDKLTLDADQHAKLDTLEAAFSVRRKALELELRADNAKLAEAIEAEHGNGPRVAAAVDACHMTMGHLQKATLEHVFAMRSLLKPDQTAVFDRAVVKALTADAR